MNKNSTVLLALATLTALGATAEPKVENVALAYNAATHGVTVTYNLLNESAIVTMCFLTNGVPFEAAKEVSGDVWRTVPTGSVRTVVWRPDLDLGERNLATYALTARVTAWATNAPPTYFVLNLKDDVTRRRYYEYEWQLPGGIASDVYRTDKMVFRRIPAAGVTFTMGAPTAEWEATGFAAGQNRGPEPQHKVTLTKDYYMGVFEVTQRQWLNVYGTFPVAQGYTGTDRDTHPVEQVCTWHEIRLNEGDLGYFPTSGRTPQNTHFLGKLRALTGGKTVQSGKFWVVTDKGYDIPTEAQWEFACRAGTTTAFNTGLELTDKSTVAGLEKAAWYATSSGGKTHRVGELQPNAWGLYDMHGNVKEWCLDCVERGTVADQWIAADRTDPEGPTSYTGTRIYRGGGYKCGANNCRSAGGRWANDWGGARSAEVGFRVVCPIDAL